MVRRTRLSQAAAALALAGGNQAVLAEQLGTTGATVSRILAGLQPMRPELAAAIAEQVGAELAARVLELVPEPARALEGARA